VNPPARVFAGWWVVAGAFVCMLTGYAVAYSFAAFFGTLEGEFGAQRGEALAGLLDLRLSLFLARLPAGLIADRLGPRPVVVGGLLVVSLGLVLAARATALWHVYLGYSLGVGLGVGLSYVPSVAAVQRWFVRRRGTASGLAISGIGVGTLIGAPLAHELIAVIGWRHTYLVLAAFAAVGAVIAGVLIRPPPQRYGLGPDGDPPAPGGVHVVAPGLTLGEAVRSRPFWTIYVGATLMSFGLFAPFVHLVPYARDVGLGEGFGVMLIVLLGVGSTVGALPVRKRHELARPADVVRRHVCRVGRDAGHVVALHQRPRADRVRPAVWARFTVASSRSPPRSPPTISAAARWRR
jgi:MFS family permease